MPARLAVVGGLLAALHGAAAYDKSLQLSDEAELHWSWDDDGDGGLLVAMLRAKTTGWVGVGFGAGSMVGSDLMVGWVDGDGAAHATDRFASAYATPAEDAQGDVTLIGGAEADGWTTIEFARPLASDDCEEDVDLVVGHTQRIVFAMGEDDPDPDPLYHASARGSVSFNLFDAQPLAADMASDAELQHFDLRVDAVEVEAFPGGNEGEGTTYWCAGFEIPDTVDDKNHIVTIEPVVDAANVAHVHHILLYSCPDLTADELSYAGFCGASNMPSALKDCNFGETIAGWAVGGGNFTLPAHAGIPVGPGDDDFHFGLMEIHYDMPEGAAAIVDSSGLRIHHTPVLREFDAGTLITGYLVPTMPELPPGVASTIVEGVCPGACIPEDLHVFASLVHMHTAGRRGGIYQMRDGQQVRAIAEDKYYDFNFQQTVVLDEELVVKAGDDLVVLCDYDTSDRSSVTVGGEGTYDEMCLGYLTYYPRQALTACVEYSAGVGLCFEKRDYDVKLGGSTGEVSAFESTCGDDGGDGGDDGMSLGLGVRPGWWLSAAAGVVLGVWVV